ncbi:hypothetical protein A3C59_01470 [Candidatus Daviesbacteria bacterium RIFCSPHIGHO2_02_FULL_36_13]|uniref:DUF3105 domain-containing protein n=1 Tax=Candidatus Daviesbacteria bacterium RIFCSPHIGHO2_02_FULL_36_13 TaxID=1797768 RepID=A0A1F5JVL9_9BACT|nr:MAG: hypothetical protein A3C59_01470 [Candidatus Daviesbacteria bacterium RIFCSPHIGHO2_02_FULL_36_13]
MKEKIPVIVISAVLIIAILAWLFVESSKPLPGTKIEDLGREHINDISKIEYNSNPPTSGTHFPVWAKKGVYDRVISDGHLVHSLEHGYVVISYNCDKQVTSNKSLVTSAYAHLGEPVEIHDVATGSAKPLMIMKTTDDSQMSGFTPQNPPPKEIELSANFQSDACKKLVSSLSSFLNKYERIIVVPRPSLDTRIAITAWAKIDKFNLSTSSELSVNEIERISKFIEAYHNQGPERTIE